MDEDRVATPAEAVKEYARNIGADYPDHAWLLTSYDTWEPNPHYVGLPVPHPEADYEFEGVEPPGFDSDERRDAVTNPEAHCYTGPDDDIPF